MNDEGIHDAAVLLLAMGADAASEVFKHLSPKEAQRLGEAMAQMKTTRRDRIESVLGRFREDAEANSQLVADTDEYVRAVLTQALGAEKAGLLIDRILQGGDVSGIESLKWMDAASVAELVRNEHPQIVASIIVHLERDQASEVLECLPERLRADIMYRIATLEGIQPSALRELNEVLGKLLSGSDRLQRTKLGGTKSAAEILNFLGGGADTQVLDWIRDQDPDLAQKIMDQMFTFADLLQVDDRGIQTLLREIQSDALVIALKGADPELREKIFRNMSQRAAETLRDDLESKGPVRLAEVESEQREILKTVRRLVDEGQISIGAGSEAYV
jgi:flagellar motor switch protein FliG